jgi:toxin ParE1/3/4
MKIIWTQSAVRDLGGIREYIAEDNPRAASTVAAHIAVAANSLRATPELGRALEGPEVRQLVIPRVPYRLIYRIARRRIEIFRALHQRRENPAGEANTKLK